MNNSALYQLLAFAPPPPAGTAANPTGQMLQMFGTMAVLFVVMYFVAIRPQNKKAKELAERVGKLKAGDQIITNSGIIGTVISIKDKTMTIRSSDSKLEISRSSVAEITAKDQP